MTEQLKNKKARFVKLGWELIEHKFRYYILNNPIIGDTDFDKMEHEYRDLAEELGEEPSASDMVDFNWNRPSCMRVALKILGAPDKPGYIPAKDGSLYYHGKNGLRKVK